MRDYSKVSPRFWTGDTGRQIRTLGPEAQVIAFYLFTCPSANMLGLYYLALPTLCHETGSPLEGALKALRSLENIGFAYYDQESEHVYLPNMAREQIGERIKEKDNRHVAVLKELETLRKTPFFNAFVTKYRDAYRLHDVELNKPLPRDSEAPSRPFKGVSNPLRSQEQEQEQEQAQEQEHTNAHRNGSVEKGRYPPDFDHHAEFKRIRAIYPPFTGRQDWITTEHHCRLRIDEGSTWDELVAGVTRYRRYCDSGGVSGPKFVMSPVKFFSAADQPWKQPWDPPPPPEPKDAGQKPITHEQREAAELRKLMARRESIGMADFRDPLPGETAADYRRAQDDEWSDRQAKLRKGLARGELPGIAKGMP